MPRKMSQKRRLAAAESTLARIFDGWVAAWTQGEWIREVPNSHAPIRWRSELMTEDERRLLEEYR